MGASGGVCGAAWREERQVSTRVMVIFSNQDYASTYDPFPPIGTCGDIVQGLDEYGEYEVVFDDWPAPTLLDLSWTAHRTMIVFIGGSKQSQRDAVAEYEAG